VHPVFRKKTHGQIIGEELHEGLAHIGTAVAEARRAATEQLVPRVEAAREASGPALDAARGAVAPRVAAAVAVAAPAAEAARDALAPRVEAARDALGPRVEAARDAAVPHLTAAVTAAQAAATRAAADLTPRVEAARGAAQKTLAEDVVPRLTAAQAATLAYAAPRVLAAREAVTPVLEHTRESISSGLGSARDELELRRLELAAATAKAAKKRRELERKAAKAGKGVRRKVGIESRPRRWPWLLAVLGIAAAVAVVLRRRSGSDDLWTPAPTGDGPVPSYREDPVPSSPSNSGKTVSTAQTTAGDATPPDTDAGSWAQQSKPTETPGSATPGTATTSPDDPALDTATASPNDQPQTASGGIGSDSEDPRNPAT
jgi:hypothetical protein